LSHLIQNMVSTINPRTIQNHKPLNFNKTYFEWFTIVDNKWLSFRRCDRTGMNAMCRYYHPKLPPILL
ncbi:MAG: hypothetical protein KAR20_16895, partial [Candidatus Heimdallarchaeota archaeon]|nr:hypothetical protein [Candidatus Heimdallarchaeota archaeon]